MLGRNLRTFDWNTEKHGAGAATADPEKHYLGICNDFLLSPYDPNQCGIYILACTDCHEPHGSSNIFLIRQKVNNGVVTVKTGDGQGPDGKNWKEWVYLCGKCHNYLLAGGFWDPHPHPDYIDDDPNTDCQCCHPSVSPVAYRPCGDCHYHGNTLGECPPSGLGCPDTKFYGEPLM